MYKFKLKEIEVGDTDTKGGKKSTVTDVNPETGAITWDIKDVADFSSTYKELEKAKDFLSKLEKTGKSKDDPAIDKLAAQIKELFNTFRTHIRKNYPEEYKRVLRLKESDRGLSWTTSPTQTGARGTIDTHTKLPKLKEKEFYEVGDIVEFPYGYSTHTGIIRDVDKRGDENDPYNWDYTVQMRGDEYEPGSRNYHDDEWNGKISYPAGHKVYGIPTKYLDESVNEGHGLDQVDLDYLQHIANKNPDDTKLEKIVKFLTKSNILVDKTKDLSKGKEVEEGEGIGYLTPRAFAKNKKSKGAPSIYYYKLGYKPVPKIKPKGFEVKQLFEKEELTEYSDFQQKRINVFDEIEEKINSISPLLSSAKNKTAEYYNENPGSYTIVYSTDMANELLDDIIELLKQSE